jgi:hypothetical protein
MLNPELKKLKESRNVNMMDPRHPNDAVSKTFNPLYEL